MCGDAFSAHAEPGALGSLRLAGCCRHPQLLTYADPPCAPLAFPRPGCLPACRVQVCEALTAISEAVGPTFVMAELHKRAAGNKNPKVGERCVCCGFCARCGWVPRIACAVCAARRALPAGIVGATLWGSHGIHSPYLLPPTCCSQNTTHHSTRHIS